MPIRTQVCSYTFVHRSFVFSSRCGKIRTRGEQTLVGEEKLVCIRKVELKNISLKISPKRVTEFPSKFAKFPAADELFVEAELCNLFTLLTFLIEKKKKKGTSAMGTRVFAFAAL